MSILLYYRDDTVLVYSQVASLVSFFFFKLDFARKCVEYPGYVLKKRINWDSCNTKFHQYFITCNCFNKAVKATIFRGLSKLARGFSQTIPGHLDNNTE